MTDARTEDLIRRQPPRLKTPLRRLRYMAETVLAYVIYYALKCLPLSASSALCGGLLGFIGPHMGISNVARANLAAAFPEKTQGEREKIVRGMWNNLGRVIGEYPHLPELFRRAEYVNPQYMEEAGKAGKPAIFFSAHMANWEILSFAAPASGVDITVVYRRPNNLWVDGLLRRARKEASGTQVEKGPSGASALFKVLRRGGIVGMLVDQKLNEGMAIPFFGRPAMTPTVCAQFALRLGCALYPARMERLEGTRLRLTLHPPMEIAPTGDDAADMRRILTEMNAQIEGWIRERPEQWLWLHKRWPISK
jgi:KDO2-lipid IV(A) lauroyltransferase